MDEMLTVTSERVDDIPLLLEQLAKMDVAALLNEHFPVRRSWRGLSPGQTGCVRLTHILSQADHRLNQVQPWVERHLHTIAHCIAQPLRALDLADDRLAALLLALSNDTAWANFESALNQRLLRVYDLQPKQVRLDSSTVNGYWQ